MVYGLSWNQGFISLSIIEFLFSQDHLHRDGGFEYQTILHGT